MNAVSDPAVIKVSFDTDQISSYLIWNVSEVQGTRNPYSTYGRHAGAIHFSKGEPIFIQVTAFGVPEVFDSMNVLDAMIYTVPHTDGDRHSAPSPFSPVRATTPVGEWEPAEVSRIDRKRKLMTQTSLTPLMVVEEDGRWAFSLILTMEIVRRMPDGGKRGEIRVFTFDPEIQVGSGTEPPRGSSGEHRLTRSG
jgi:hypothetical protein